MEDVVTEVGIEKFRAAVTDYVSVMVKALSDISRNMQSYGGLYLRSARTASDSWWHN